MPDTAHPAITNIFVLMLENHSFDNMLGRSGIPGLTVAPVDAANDYRGMSYPVFSPAPASMTTDPGHEFADAMEQLCGAEATCSWECHCDRQAKRFVDCTGCAYPPIGNSGFVSSYATSTSEDTGRPDSAHFGDIMGLFDTATQLPVLHALASEFAVCDAWHSSLPGPTWPNRFFVHGASSAGMTVSPDFGEEVPWETYHGFEYANGSIYDAMRGKHGFRFYQDKANAFSDNPSHWYQGGWISQVAAIKDIHLWDIHSLKTFRDDINAMHGDVPAYRDTRYTFIEPNYGASFFSKQDGNPGPRYNGGSSQHPEDNCYGGEGLIKYVYESIRNSPLWKSSLLIITYDEHGGFYDHVEPPCAVPPGDPIPEGQEKLARYCFDFDRLGVRVPAVIVSPWVPKGHVDHTQYDHTSVLATLETMLGLDPLTARDKAANTLWDQLSEPVARTDCPTALPEPKLLPIPTRKPTGRQQTDDSALPTSGNHVGFLHVLLKAEIELAERAEHEIIADFHTITTHAHATAYLQRMRAMLEGRAAG